ncbi:acyl-CoA thioesterase II [Nitratireductor aquimarinus]|uniref:acyl-CoA thioesterase II n=1 Tax=Alphaproteobacteria TaxID=28211 RepID=UPI000DE0CAC2|nr:MULTISPECIES: acyl-CoA thioesterase II [Alphaproteobacteria]MBY6021897.1 acyl-CoA thioesterase II [Nitratireductor sp. DP7N14-4]MBN7757110.1 acyl-CoA thioesterase II [Nitratireductor aquimarinus]MBN7761052.1 acyl-CoA thioesterase II [Nitratireductor aquibiodomus]MBN7777352.1 acyl-CoA thioesterase II [Nitratireductor pacificus]MBN7781023.1 acyl-CoA thioesterase II [Nitratireductor pacificus]
MSSAMQDLLAILDLETLEHNLFRGRSPQSAWQRVFGGQVIGQALVAAQRTVNAARHVHSLHCYFMRPGDPAVPIIYEVDRIRDGGSFTTRRVVAIQHGHAIFSLSASFQKEEPGLDHQIPMPQDVTPPENLRTQREFLQEFGDSVPENIRRYWARERPIEVRPVIVEHYTSRDKLPPRQDVWIRTTGPVPDDRALQAAVLAYLSDMTLLDTSTFAHGRNGFDPDIQMASLDHAMWFHRPHRLDDWLLYTQDSPSAQGARGFSRGSLYALDGTLVASVAQEGLVRLRTK